MCTYAYLVTGEAANATSANAVVLGEVAQVVVAGRVEFKPTPCMSVGVSLALYKIKPCMLLFVESHPAKPTGPI